MSFLTGFRCIDCGQEFAPDAVRYLCPTCSADYHAGMPLKGILEALFDYPAITKAWKHGHSDCLHKNMHLLCNLLSPVDEEYYPNLPVGFSPLVASHALMGQAVHLKFDGVNPSGSYKDRSSHLMVAEARRLGIKQIVCASTGNAACSTAALCAAAGLEAVIFAPQSAPVAKLVQIRVHGARLHKVDGTYDDAFAAALEYAAQNDCLCRNTAYHPYTIEGKKTAGLELWLQMGKVPDYIFIPTGDGVILSGIYKAFTDLQRCGLIDRLPALIAVQAESSDAITRYHETGSYQDALKPDTIADSISVSTPSAAHLAVQALNETKGFGIRVTEAEIQTAQKVLAQRSGIFCEPSSAATLAALYKAKEQSRLIQDASIVLMLTGHGLKDIQAVKLDD